MFLNDILSVLVARCFRSVSFLYNLRTISIINVECLAASGVSHKVVYQGRMLFFLLLPVFLIIFIGGMLSFLYTRDIILNQWNESAVLKLHGLLKSYKVKKPRCPSHGVW